MPFGYRETAWNRTSRMSRLRLSTMMKCGDGDVGVFCVDGATVIKQWHYDRMLGITYLFSLNRKRSDADLVITASSGRSLVWQGRVMTKKRYPLPGR